jgi:HEAT repeat protein
MEPARGVDWVMPVAMVHSLHQQHPECLIIPEWSKREYFAYSAPYSSANLRQGGTSDAIRRVWPGAFRVVSVNPGLLAERWSDYVHSVQGGDVLLFPPWYAARENTLVSGVYREAEYLRALGSYRGSSKELAVADTPAARYAAAHRLGEEQESDALIALLDDEDVVVRRRALQSLAMGPPITDAALLVRLAALFEGDRNDRESAILRNDAGKTLARSGAPAIPHLLPLLDDRRMQLQAVAALGETGVTDDNVVARLRKMIRDETLSAGVREQAVKAVGKLRAKSAVPELLEVLKIEERNLEHLRGAAVVALGKIGDSRAVGPLVEHLDARYSTVVVYWIERALDEALRSLTGVEGVVGRQEWRAWAEQ